MRRGFVLALASLASACSPSVDVVELPSDGARSALVVVKTPIALSAEAIELGAEGAKTIVYPRPLGGGEFTLYALEFRCPLARLGLAAGSIDVHQGGDGALLPAPSRAIYQATPAGVVALDALPAELAGVRLQLPSPPSPCVDLGASLVEINRDELGLVGAAVALDGERALIATGDGRFYVITSAGKMEQAQVPPETPHIGAFRASDGTIWLSGREGVHAQGSLQTGFADRPSSAPGFTGSWMRLEGPRDAGVPFELFLISGNLRLEHFDGARWETLAMGADDVEGRGDLAWIGPGHAILAGFDGARLIEVRDGRRLADLSLPELLAGERPISIARLGELTAIGTSSGALYLDGRKLAGVEAVNPTLAPIDVIAPIDGGILFGGPKGVLAQYHPAFGFCEPKSLASGSILRLVALERGFLAVTRPLFHGEPLTVTVLSRADEAPSGSCE